MRAGLEPMSQIGPAGQTLGTADLNKSSFLQRQQEKLTSKMLTLKPEIEKLTQYIGLMKTIV